MIRRLVSKLHEIRLGAIRTDTAKSDIYVWLEEAAIMFRQWRQLNSQRLDCGLVHLKLA